VRIVCESTQAPLTSLEAAVDLSMPD
jgi:hypothetical protein